MPTKSKKIAELVELSEESAVVELALRGWQPKQIADELEITPKTVQTHLDDALARVQARLLDKSERMVAVNLLRAERLLKAVSPFALGGTIEMHDEADGLIKEVFVYPDRHWGKLYLDILKMENEVHDKILKATAKADDKSGNMYVDHMEVTVAAGGDLYQHAQAQMEEDYLSEYLDMDATDLIEGEIIEDDPSEIEKRIADLDKTMKRLLPDGDDDDE